LKLEQALGTGVDAGLHPPSSNLQPPRAPADQPRLTEALLFRLWAGQRFPASALATTEGTPLRVLQPGRPGRGAGPDFRDAIIAPPRGRLLRGDVELHVRAPDFVAHGHANDPRYNNVVLHVVYDSAGRRSTTLASGRDVPIVPLRPWLERRSRELAGWLERPTLWREPCQDAVARLGRDEVAEFLDALGDERFAARRTALSPLITERGAGETLFRALLEGLSYGGDRSLLEQIADALSYAALSRELDRAGSEGERAAAAGRLLRNALPGLGHGTIVGRPANGPERRLSGLAKLLARHHPLEPVAAGLAGSSRELVAAWCAPPDIGRSRAIELLTNAVLPWAAARAKRLGLPDDAARAAFASLPRPAHYGVLAFLERNLTEAGDPLPLSARRQQGLLALYKSECSTGGCGRCRLS
jgi:Protein of unknown function (DUF2851)